MLFNGIICLTLHFDSYLLLGEATLQELWVRAKVISIIAQNRMSMGQTTAKRTPKIGLQSLFKCMQNKKSVPN